MIVHVHAYENAPGGEAGDGGFDWYRKPEDADAAFAASGRTAQEAHFRFDVDVESTDDDAITDEIDAQLSDLTASAERRYVGSDVLDYWQKNDFKMGDADGPAAPAHGM